jgi:hypothetical protein
MSNGGKSRGVGYSEQECESICRAWVYAKNNPIKVSCMRAVICCHRSHVYFRAVLRRRKSFSKISLSNIELFFHQRTILNENRQACGPNSKT